MTLLRYPLLACLGIIMAIQAVAQQQQVDSLRKKFERYRTAQEKIYVHIDRALYVTGETMWFKIYYTDAALHHPVELSRVAYLEVLNADDEPVIQTKVGIDKNGGSGSVFIPATLNSGTFTVRAYTVWMKNFSPDFYFHTTISVINPFRSPELVKSAAAKQPDAQFFPEGGNFVNGLNSKVAFRVVDPSGKGIDFEGSLLNQQNETVATFKPRRFGIGHFFFTPTAGSTYHAVIKDAQGRSYTYPIASAQENGYTLSIDSKNIRIQATTANAPYVILFIHTRQMIQRAEVVFMKEGKGTATLDNNHLPEGITHITLFDAAMTPLCERLYFKQPAARLSLAAQPDRTEYDTRHAVNVAVQAQGNTTPANVSIAVYKVDSLPGLPSGQDIASYFWLSSDLRGEVESPGFYLNTADSSAATAADDLMLTHGWRRFVWKDVISKGKPSIQFIPEVKGHIIEAKVTDHTDSAVQHVQTYLSAPGKIIRLYGSRSNQAGKTRYEMREFYGNHKVVLQTNRNRDSTYTTRIISPFSDRYTTRALPTLKLSTTMEQEILTKTVAMQVQDVYGDEKNYKILNAVRDSSAFYGKPDETYLLDDYTRFPVMEEVMREYVPGVLVRKRRDGFHFIVLDRVKTGILQDDPVVLLDGVPIFDADEIMAFDPLKVKKLDVLTRQYYLGIMVMQGIVSYTTYHGDLGGFKLNSRALVLDYEGLQINREFYSPVYDDRKARSSRIPDQRSLVYWNPEVTIGNGEKKTLSFYTSDLTGQYQVSVQALTEDGAPASTSSTFTVKRFDN